jgi:hypothetical protein
VKRAAAAASAAVAAVPRAGLESSGALTVYEDDSDAGRPVYRKFCGQCGSPVFTETPDAEAQGMVFIKAGTLDEVGDLAPAIHFWTSSAQGWVTIPEGAQVLPEQ